MAVITISRQFGSGGEEITSRVCQVMGYHLFNKRMIAEAAREVGLSEAEVADLSEENYKVRSFFERLFGGSVSAHYAGLWPEDIATMRSMDELRVREEEAFQLTRKAILNACHAGNMVIVGRGGQIILKDRPGVLHVRIDAPVEERIERIKNALRQSTHKYETDADLHRAAQEQILQRDAASADYIERFYNEDWNNPLLYHLIINTGKLTIEQAVQVITNLASWY